MELVLAFIVLFVAIGIIAPAYTKQVYSLMIGGIVVIVVLFYVLWFH